jgi:hypothetical protein
MMPDDHTTQDDEAVLRAATSLAAPTDLDPIARSLRAIRDELCRPPGATQRWNHVAAMRRAARPPRRRGRGTVFAVAVATVGIVGATTGLAAAGHLPGPAQEQAARLAEVVGIDLPGGEPAPARRSAASREETSSPPRAVPSVRARDRAPLPVAAQRPGAGGTPPGRSVPAPGTTASPPAPAQSGSAPGHDPDGPGSSELAPGHGGTPPGHTGAAPGQSGSAPGHDPDGPGSSELAPGHGGTPPGQGGTPPGQAGGASGPGPGRSAPGPVARVANGLAAPEEIAS